MNLSRGAIHFRRLFSLRQLAIGNCEPFTDRIIRKFLEIGEGVAARWIEMPHGILLLQMVSDKPDSGAIYLYDRQQRVFYMVGFDGPEDNLTLEEFNQLLSEYKLIQYAEQPSLIHFPVPPKQDVAQTTPTAKRLPDQAEAQPLVIPNANLFGVLGSDVPLRNARQRRCRSVYRSKRQVWCQALGSA